MLRDRSLASLGLSLPRDLLLARAFSCHRARFLAMVDVMGACCCGDGGAAGEAVEDVGAPAPL